VGKIIQVPKFSLADLFSREEITAVEKLWVTCNGEGQYRQFHMACKVEIVEPAMERINKITGQENDPDYIAYCIEFALTR